MTEATVSFAGNLTDQPQVRYPQGERRSIVESTDSVPEWGAERPRRCIAGKACGLYGSGGLVATVVRSAPDRKEYTNG